MLLNGKKIVVGVCGGIAAYKIPFLVRLLKKEGAEVKMVCTPAALQFVTALTLETVSQNAVYSDLFAPKNEFSTAHIAYADWADYLIVAPATANTLAKFATGIADNALSTLFSAYSGRQIDRCLLVPAMNTNMYLSPAVQANLQRLQAWGAKIMPPESGSLACGTEGLGRMPEPEAILRYFLAMVQAENSPYQGKHVLVTAGATIEDIDPVRYITNRATGLMGCALSDELSQRGAKVHLVCGEQMSHRPKIEPFETVITRSAAQMFEACTERWPQMDIAILSAAVADYTPAVTAERKIKKGEGALSLHLVRTQDILKTLGQNKKSNQILVGFALETDHEMENAAAKLKSKNADYIVLNSLAVKGAGFAGNTNQICILDKDGGVTPYPLVSKSETAVQIIDHIKL